MSDRAISASFRQHRHTSFGDRFRLNNAKLFDGERDFAKHLMSVTVAADRIEIVEPAHEPEPGERVFDLEGMTLMPGLIDAHFHANSPSLDVAVADGTAPSHLAQYARLYLEDQLSRGFTTVRDAGGADPGLSQAVEEGLIAGPRLFVSGRAISQSGGHGNFHKGYEPCGCTGYAGSLACVIDGADNMRRHVRQQLHEGVHQIKLFMSGGVLSPSDPIWMDQFTDEEVRAAVEESARRRTYVMAHAHAPSAIRRCAELGIRSIEHGSLLDATTARIVADHGCYITPTLCIIDYVSNERSGLPPFMLEKARAAAESAAEAVRHAETAGIKLGLGTDLLGEAHGLELVELRLRARISGNLSTLRSATSINAEMMQLSGEIGTVRPGAFADLLIVDGDPIADIEVLVSSDQALRAVFKGGRLMRGALAKELAAPPTP